VVLHYEREWPWQRALGLVRPTLETNARVMAAPTPALVVSTGRRAGAVARWLRAALTARDGRGPRLVHVQDPRYGHAGFDLIAVPAHDRHVDALRHRPNVRVVTGAPHALTPERLAAAAPDWRDTVAALPRPWIAVLVGGDSGRRRLDAPVAGLLADQVGALAAAAGGSLLVTTSRRTRPDALDALRRRLTGPHVLVPWSQEPDENPYLGFLGHADGVVVTGDSMSMLTEATVTRRPLWVFAPDGWARGPHARFHADLIAAGVARRLGPGARWADWTYDPVNPAGEIAAAARAVLQADGMLG
jgi:mitochondrial fission protein ELM1